MRQVIDTGLPALAQPFSWAVRSGGILFTAHGPVLHDGRVDTGSIDRQTRLSLDNLQQALKAADASLSDVAQVLIFLTDIADMPAVDAVYREYFQAPYPNRSAVAVTALAAPGMRIELVAYAFAARASAA
jgi:enamine deaminase RidA (YjgF/YER057c/UK114 family)